MRRALAFLTPFGAPAPPTPESAVWFPAVGVLLGGGVGLAWWGAGQIWSPLVAAAIAVAVDLALTGMLHLDGLCDTADGLLPPLERERRLEVMAAPDVGAFAVGTAATVLLLRWAALASMDASPLLVAGVWCLSRTAMLITLSGMPYARPVGLASAFLGRPRYGPVIAGVSAALLVAIAGSGVAGAAAVGACGFGAAAVVLFARRRLGGFTGDVLGAAAVVGETVGLVTAAAW